MKSYTKKILLAVFSFTILFILLACSSQSLASINEKLNVPKEVSQDFNLPASLDSSTLTWTSNDTSAILISTQVINNEYTATVTRQNEDKNVTLTVSIKSGDQTESFNHTIKVISSKTALYEVTYKSIHGDSKVTLTSGSLVNEKTVPIVEGYAFIGYFNELTYDTFYTFNTPITNSLTIYEYWVETPTTNQEIVDLDTMLVSKYLKVSQNGQKIVLPQIGYLGTTITWLANDLNIVTTNGFILPSFEGDKTVTLTGTVRGKRGSNPKTITTNYTIPAFDPSTLEVSSVIELPFTNKTDEYEVSDKTLQTYFLGNTDVPFVTIEDFLFMLDGFIDYKELNFTYNENVLTLSYDTKWTENNETLTETYTAIIDFNENTINVETISFFDGYVVSTATDYSEGINYIGDPYFEAGEDIIFDFDKYRIVTKVITDGAKDEFLLPFHIVNLIFTGGSYYNVYYNGDGYAGIYSTPDQATQTEIKTSSLNNTNMSDAYVIYNYDYLAFTLDYYYGLKEDRNVDTYYNVLSKSQTSLLNNNPKTVATALFNLIYKEIDESHTYASFFSVYAEPTYNITLTSISQLGPNQTAWYNVLWDVQEKSENRFGNNVPDYRFLDTEKTTAVIYLESFETAPVGEVKNKDNDSDAFMTYALRKIYDENPNVENIVLDLSYNTGGNMGALLRVLGYMTDKPLELSYQDPLEKSKITYFVDLDQAAYDVNWYVITTKVTFSAANLLAAIAKNQGLATILGTTSGGGASSIIPIITPDGSMFLMSSQNVISLRTQNEDLTYTYKSIEYGITPDIIVPVSSIYNDSHLMSIINQN